jgi:hypothetical protein
MAAAVARWAVADAAAAPAAAASFTDPRGAASLSRLGPRRGIGVWFLSQLERIEAFLTNPRGAAPLSRLGPRRGIGVWSLSQLERTRRF